MTEQEKNILRFLLPPVLILAAGLFFIISTVPKSIRWNDLKNNGVRTEATVTSIRKSTSQHGRTTSTVHYVYVKYTFEGKEYEGRLNTYSPEMQEGGTVAVTVSRENPYDFMAEPKNYGSMYFTGGILILTGGAIIFIGYTRLRA